MLDFEYKPVLYVRVWVWIPILYPSSTHTRPPPPLTMVTQETSDSKSLHRNTSRNVFFEKSIFDVFLTSVPLPLTLVTQQASDSQSPYRKTYRNVFFEKSVFDVFLTSAPLPPFIPHDPGHPTVLRFEVPASKNLQKCLFRKISFRCFFDLSPLFTHPP